MKMYRKAVIALAAVSLVSFAGVATAAQKVAYVDAIRLLADAPQAVKVKEKIRKEFTHREETLIAQRKQIKKLQDKLIKDGAVMSSAEVKRLERDILSRGRKLKNATGEFQEDLNLRQNEELQKLDKVITAAVVEVAKSEKIDIVLEGNIVYASDSADITGKVLAKLKKR